MGEPIETMLKKLIQSNVITLQEPKAYDLGQFKPSWWDENALCDYHRSKGHKTSSCKQLRNLIQDLIKNDTIKFNGQQYSSNTNHTIHKNPLQDHGLGNPSSLGQNTNNEANHTHAAFDYSSGPIINHLRAANEYVNTITIKKTFECNVTTHQGKIMIPGPSAKPPQPKGKFNLVDQLGKTPS